MTMVPPHFGQRQRSVLDEAAVDPFVAGGSWAAFRSWRQIASWCCRRRIGHESEMPDADETAREHM